MDNLKLLGITKGQCQASNVRVKRFPDDLRSFDPSQRVVWNLGNSVECWTHNHTDRSQ